MPGRSGNRQAVLLTDANRILYNYDCLEVLNDEVALPSNSVDLIYADPPFNSESRYNLPFTGKDKDTRPVEAFNDTWSWSDREEEALRDLSRGPQTSRLTDVIKLAQTTDRSRALAAYLVNMATRLIPMRRVLSPKGSIYLHCDDTASHYLKLLMDVIFGRERFRNEILWKRNSSHNDGKWIWGRVTDTVLFYGGNPLNKDDVRVPLDKDYVERTYRYKDERGAFSVDNLSAKGLTGGGYFYDFHGHPGPWRYPEKRMMNLEEIGLIYLPDKPRGVPRFKRYLDTNKGQMPPNLWTDIPKVESVSRERLGYPTQKPMKLLERIVKASSKPGDLVLDPFCGCGTAVHVSEKLGRRWIGIDISAFAVGLMRERILRNFEHLTTDDVLVKGVPVNINDAEALAQRDKFEFEKWVCGAIGAEGMFHDPGERGPDGGVDGVLRFYPFRMGEKPKAEFAIVQVKGGNVTADSVRALKSTVDKFDATAGVMVCFARQMQTVENQRSRAMFSDDAGNYPVIQGYSIEDLLVRKPLDLPLYGRRERRGGRISIQEELLAADV